MPRRVNLVILLGLIIGAVFSFGLSAGAQEPDATGPTTGTKDEQIEVAQAELTELRRQAEVAAEEYNSAAFRAELLNGEIANTTRDLEEAEGRLATAQEDLSGQTAQMYKSGNVAFLDVLFGAKDFNDFATRLDLWARLIGNQQAEVEELRAARDEAEAQKNERALQVENQEKTLADMQARWEWANALQGDAEAYLNSLSEELRAEIQAAQEAAAAEAAEEAQRIREEQEEAAREAAAAAAAEEEAQTTREQATVKAAPVAQTTPPPDPAAKEAEEAAAEQARLAAEQKEAQRQAEENAAEQAAFVEQARKSLNDAQNEAERKKAQDAVAAAESEARAEANRAAEAELAKKNAENALTDLREQAQELTRSASSTLEPTPDLLPKDQDQPKGEAAPVLLPKDQDQPKAASDPDSDPKAKGLPKGEGQPKAAPKAASGGGGAPIAEARSVLGDPYVVGGEAPGGFDCSGLVKWSYRGIRSLPHSVDGIGSSGTQISVAEAGPGDVLVWPGYHVAMVTDPGMMIHASNYHMQVIEVSQGDMEPASYAVRL